MASTYHDGELAVQRQAGVEGMARRVGLSIKDTMALPAQAFVRERPFVVVASTDTHGRVWASLLVGTPGFMEPVDERTLRIDAAAIAGDPLVANLDTNSAVGLLLIDPATRRRMRVNGNALRQGNGTLLVTVQQAYANCPKYIQARDVMVVSKAASTTPVVHRSTQLTPTQQDWIASADTFFIATAHPARGADVSHRGGNPGFVHVLGSHTLLFPDYAGNTMFQTLGNIQANPYAGLLFVNWSNGSLLQLTGSATIVWDTDVAAQFVGSERAVRVELSAAIELTEASSLRSTTVDYSPFNPAEA